MLWFSYALNLISSTSAKPAACHGIFWVRHWSLSLSHGDQTQRALCDSTWPPLPARGLWNHVCLCGGWPLPLSPLTSRHVSMSHVSPGQGCTLPKMGCIPSNPAKHSRVIKVRKLAWYKPDTLSCCECLRLTAAHWQHLGAQPRVTPGLAT